jgi:hypothetical protein
MSDPIGTGPTRESFPFDARLAWMELSPDEQEAILESAWCPACLKRTRFEILGGKLVDAGLSLRGRCRRCGGELSRLVER